MRTSSGIVLPLLAIVVGIGMIVAAGSIMSNKLRYENEVSGITISANWDENAKVVGAQYDFTVTYASPAGTPNCPIVFTFEATGIVPADISLEYWSGTEWVSTTFAPDGVDIIRGVTMAIAGGTTGGYDYHLTYNNIGTYVLNVWAEAI